MFLYIVVSSLRAWRAASHAVAGARGVHQVGGLGPRPSAGRRSPGPGKPRACGSLAQLRASSSSLTEAESDVCPLLSRGNRVAAGPGPCPRSGQAEEEQTPS